MKKANLHLTKNKDRWKKSTYTVIHEDSSKYSNKERKVSYIVTHVKKSTYIIWI